jgi:hypothetical protein
MMIRSHHLPWVVIFISVLALLGFIAWLGADHWYGLDDIRK